MTILLATQTVRPETTGLDPLQYSAYKYGAKRDIAAYVQDLTELGLASIPEVWRSNVTITAPGSRSVPIGADLLADGVLAELNHCRVAAGHAPAVRAKLHRHIIPAGDYGAQSLAGRQALLAQEHVTTIPALIEGRHVVVVDDLWVTGLSAAVTTAAIERLNPASLTYLVIARVQPEYAAAYAKIEHDLNHARVSDLPSLTELLRQDQVVVTQRLCKFVLSQPVRHLSAWLPQQASSFVGRLHCACLAEGFGLMPAYAEAFSHLAVHARRLGDSYLMPELDWRVST